jgi:RNA recognition motif-containing protein
VWGDFDMNIFVGNLSLELTEEELRSEFSSFGQVNSVNIMNDRDIGSGQQCGYGFVAMELESEGKAAIAGLNGKNVRGRSIQVIESLSYSGNTPGNSLDSRRGSRFNRMQQRSVKNKYIRFT